MRIGFAVFHGQLGLRVGFLVLEYSQDNRTQAIIPLNLLRRENVELLKPVTSIITAAFKKQIGWNNNNEVWYGNQKKEHAIFFLKLK